MRRIFTLVSLIFILNISLGQNLNGYKYVYVETVKYTSGRTDIWGISSKLRSSFRQKGFVVFSEETTITEEFKNNPCLLLECYIDHTNVVTGVNKVTITLKNCKGEVVHTHTGSAMGWSVQDDFNKATRRAFERMTILPAASIPLISIVGSASA